MATTDSAAGAATGVSDAAVAIREASFVHLVARADGDALAAAGILAGACAAAGVPYHASAVRTREGLAARLAATDESAKPLGVGVGGESEPVSLAAHDAAVSLGAEPDPALALAGAFAAGAEPGRAAAGLLERADLERRPGVAVPTRDLADGLAHTTLAHAAFSGDREAAREAVPGSDEGPLDKGAASLLAIAAVESPAASERAATAVERALRPYVGGPLVTVGGCADALGALSRTAPGAGIALALGGDVGDAALEAWREEARAAHAAVSSADVARYDGLVVARVPGAVEPTARLLRDFRSPEPVVIAVGDGEAGVAALEADVASPVEAAADRVGGSGLGRGTRGYARFDPDLTEAFVDAAREELA